MARTIIGLDLGWSTIKAVVISAHFNKRELLSQHTIPLEKFTTPEEQEEAWRHGLAQLRDLGLPPTGATVIASFPGVGINSHMLDLPFKENKKIDTTLNGELDFQQTIVDVEDLAASWTHAKIEQERPEGPYPVLVATVKQNRVASILTLLKECGFDPQMLLHPAAGWPLAFQQVKKAQPAANTDGAEENLAAQEDLQMFVDIGAARTNVAIFTAQGELMLIRTMAFGASQADQAIAEALDIPLTDAGALRETESTLIGLPLSDEQEQLQNIILNQYRLLVGQLRLTINRLPNISSRLRITLMGGGSRQKGITQFLEDELGYPVNRIDSNIFTPFFNGAGQLDTTNLTAASFTLAAISNRRGGLLDFRRGAFAYQGELSWIKGQVIRLVVGSVAVFIFALASLGVQLKVFSGIESNLDKQFCKITKQTVKKEICEPRAALSALSTPTGPQGNTLPTYSAIEQFVAISRGIPADLQVTFQDLNISSDRVIIKGTCADFESLDKLVDALSKLSCVTEAKQTRSSKSKDEVEFNITMKYDCEPGVTPLSEVG